jgi:hypothetical protein
VLLLQCSEISSSARSPDPPENLSETHSFPNAKSSMFMRVQRTVPQFTFSFSALFVNQIYAVSTGFLRFFLVLFGFRHIDLQKTREKRHLQQIRSQTRAL